MKDITVQELLEMKDFILIDVRSPGEYKDASIPGAINIPIFTNEERKEIGTIYKQIGANAAKWRGMELVQPKLPNLLHSVKKIVDENKQPIFHCWRGGMRSGAMATFVEFAGMPSLRLSGGYRAYRQYILEQIPQLLPDQAIVLHGMTGTGKTEILKKLKVKGYPIIDLEKMAAHRGSLFGTLGYNHNGNNQKVFDSLLFENLKETEGCSYFLVEAESRRIGKVGQPDELYEKKTEGINIYLQASLDTRIERIYKEYFEPFLQDQVFHEVFLEKVMVLKKRLKNEDVFKSLIENTVNRQFFEVIRLLLVYYYDPRYQFKMNEYKNDFTYMDANNIEKVAEGIEQFIQLHVHTKDKIIQQNESIK